MMMWEVEWLFFFFFVGGVYLDWISVNFQPDFWLAAYVLELFVYGETPPSSQ